MLTKVGGIIIEIRCLYNGNALLLNSVKIHNCDSLLFVIFDVPALTVGQMQCNSPINHRSRIEFRSDVSE